MTIDSNSDARLVELGRKAAIAEADWQNKNDAAFASEFADPRCETLQRVADAAFDRYRGLLTQIEKTPARTIMGMRVKAAAILAWSSDGCGGDEHHEVLAYSLARDLLGVKRGTQQVSWTQAWLALFDSDPRQLPAAGSKAATS